MAGTAYLLAMKVSGSNPVQLEILFQGALLFSYSDSAANRILNGAPGIQNYNSGVRYDHFVVSSLTPPTGNQPPVASFSAGPTSGSAPLAVSFNASASSDPDGSIANFSWNFGDGTTGSGVTTGHTYQTAGTFTATLTVTDNGGAQNSTTRTISVQSTGGGRRDDPLRRQLQPDRKHPGDELAARRGKLLDRWDDGRFGRLGQLGGGNDVDRHLRLCR
ncbi:MAG: PKD domain-containing protein [Candidatus Manganitrophus sp.]|nr:PKD domain-containing protein [Candidatus Manganitrophus sp.]WDT69430.1 MAG: PKD domain-containing protein [Candidatus Manganitrophus sp.]WDT78980.1 MAG: PKD domain-containing protein [Candidatus Manganitrophus sp.]